MVLQRSGYTFLVVQLLVHFWRAKRDERRAKPKVRHTKKGVEDAVSQIQMRTEWDDLRVCSL